MAGPVRRLRRGRRHHPEDDEDEVEDYAEAQVKSEPTPPSEHTRDEYVIGNESSDDWQPDTNTPDAVAPRKSASSKSSRLTRAAATDTSVTVSRPASHSPEESKRSIRLTLKMPSSKLREVTNSSGRTSSGRRNVNVFTDNPIVSGPRSSRTKKKLVEINTSEEEDSDGEGAYHLDDAPEEEEDEEDDDNLDADGDVDMDDISPQPPISKRTNRLAAMAPPAKGKPVKGVEEKEMELAEDDDDEDEELSELDSDAEGEADETLVQDDEMGEGGEDEELDEEDEEDDEDEEEVEVDDETPATGSRASTPDYNKLTKRQRGSLGSDFLQLPMEPQVKKHLTAEEHAMRRAEMARRRKNLSEKRNEEEKMDTINRLLKKQAPKKRGRFPVTEATADGTPDIFGETERADPTMIRWISTRDTCQVALPEDILGTPVAQAFGHLSKVPSGRKLVQEV